MKSIILLMLSAVVVAGSANAQTLSPQGNWSRGDGKAKVRIAPCGAELCAVNTWIRAGVRDEKVGDKLVMSVVQDNDRTWKGKAFDPQRNLTYRLTIDVKGATMTTSGCVLGGLICKHVDWTRLDR